MKLRTIDLGAVELAVSEAGTGGSPLLVVHGFTGAKEDFADWIDPLADRGFHVVAPDLRGHGASSKPADEAAYSLATMATDLLALAAALDWSHFALLGHSMGGMVAQVVALSAADRLGALVLMDTGHGQVEGIDPVLAAVAIDVARADGMERLAELAKEYEAPLSSTADARVRAERPGYVEFGERKFRACSPAMYAAMATELLCAADRLDALSSLDVPTLVLVGDEDTAFVGPSRNLAAAIPGASLAVVPGAGHSPQFEAPDAWWAEVEGFLTEHGHPA